MFYYLDNNTSRVLIFTKRFGIKPRNRGAVDSAARSRSDAHHSTLTVDIVYLL